MNAAPDQPPRIAVIGGGISGLALGHRLLGRADVTVFEASPCAGGHARTVREAGFLVETGPNGFLDRHAGVVDLAGELGLSGELIESRPAADRRFIVRQGRLRRVPDSPSTLLSSGALSPAGKLRLLLEPWARSAPADVEETVHEFALRRLGREAADVLVDTAIAGISAGDSRLLSLPAAFPLMATMEREHGSLIRAFAARRRAGRAAPRLLTFRSGMGQLIDALGDALGPRLRTGAPVEGIERTRAEDGGGAWRIRVAGGATYRADRVVLALPARAAASVVRGLDGELADTLSRTPFANVVVVALAWPLASIPRQLRGYGYLVTRDEGHSTLGVTWESSLFDGRAPAGFALVRAILGGPRHPEIAALTETERIAVARAEIALVLGIVERPMRTWTFAWPGAIAQYVRGHRERVAAARAAATRHAGLSLCGTSYDGVSFGAAVEAGRAHADALLAAGAVP